MPEILVFTPVHPIKEEWMAGYESCEFCGHSAPFDIWAGRMAETEWRTFYRVNEGGVDGIVICENCVPDYLKELDR